LRFDYSGVRIDGRIITRYRHESGKAAVEAIPAKESAEDLSAVRGPYRKIKTIGIGGVETYLAKELLLHNEGALNEYRDYAKKIAADLGYLAEYEGVVGVKS
jgi:hypothetical protein